MKRIVVLFSATLFLLAAVSSASAGGLFQVGGGLAFPTGDIADGYNSAFAFDGTFLFAAGQTFAVGVNAGYRGFGIDDSEVPASITVDGGTFSALNLCGELRLQNEALWVMAGGGSYTLSLTDLTMTDGVDTLTLTAPDSETKFGGYFGAGFSFPLNPSFSLGVEGKYHVVFDDIEDGDADTLKFFEIKMAAIFTM